MKDRRLSLLQLTKSYVSTYGELRQASAESHLPVPATFRAAALADFEQSIRRDENVATSMVGLTGKEIATPPTDQHMADQITLMATSAKAQTSLNRSLL